MSTTMTTNRRFALDDLVRIISERSATELAVRLRVSPRTVIRYRRHGLSALQADRAAVAAGFHPGEVWADWF